MTTILVTYDMFREGFTELESKYEVTFPEGRDFTYEEVLEMIPEYDVLCSMFDFPVNKELIDHALCAAAFPLAVRFIRDHEKK